MSGSDREIHRSEISKGGWCGSHRRGVVGGWVVRLALARQDGYQNCAYHYNFKAGLSSHLATRQRNDTRQRCRRRCLSTPSLSPSFPLSLSCPAGVSSFSGSQKRRARRRKGRELRWMNEEEEDEGRAWKSPPSVQRC